MGALKRIYKRTIDGVDWILLASTIPPLIAGLITMRNFSAAAGPADNYFMKRQIIWIAASFLLFFLIRSLDWKFFKRGGLFLIFVYLFIIILLVLLLILENKTRGVKSWFHFYYFSFQPSDFAKIALILILAKYFSLRHIEIPRLKHIIISIIYAGLSAGLILFQPDFGSTAAIFLIWFGMILISGVNKRHLFLLIFLTIAFLILSWFFILAPYQKLRIKTFINPLLDPQGAGYNVLQSKIAVGSGGIFGKGIGFGSQSRLNFLPEPETDFIFAAFAEEWGFIGVLLVFIFFGIFLERIFRAGFAQSQSQNNFERLFAIGLAFLFFSQLAINIGMNIGLLPVTGITLPLMSYGGSHLISSFIALGIFSSFSRR